MTIKLNNQSLITDYVAFLLQFKEYIDNTIRHSKKTIDDFAYVKLRQHLQWYNRFCNLGKMVLLNKSRKSHNQFENLDEIVLLIKVHYKWLKKYLICLDEYCQDFELNNELNENKCLRTITDKIDQSIISVYDPFRKICKMHKKYIISPLPFSSDIVLKVISMLQNVTASFNPSKNKYISSNLIDEPKFVTLQTKEAIIIRSELISLWNKIYANEPIDDNVLDVLQDINKFCEKRINISKSSADFASVIEPDVLLSKDKAKMMAKIQIWPLHEYMFILFVGMFQRIFCKNLSEELHNIILPPNCFSIHNFNIPNIPAELHGILTTIYNKQHNAEERKRLIFALFISFSKFNENSYAIKNYKQVFIFTSLHKFYTSNYCFQLIKYTFTDFESIYQLYKNYIFKNINCLISFLIFFFLSFIYIYIHNLLKLHKNLMFFIYAFKLCIITSSILHLHVYSYFS
jgi:hypothetical protein